MVGFPIVPRIIHQTSVGILIGGTVFAHFGGLDLGGSSAKIFIGAAVLALISGLLNAHFVKPGALGPKAKTYRLIVYAVKIPLWCAMSPLLNKMVPADQVSLARLVAVIFLVVISSYAKYFREENSPAKEARD